MEKLLTSGEVAELLQVSKDKVMRWSLKGVNGVKLKRVKFGAVRYVQADIEEFINALKEG